MRMEKLINEWIKIEEYLKTELERLLLVMMNSNNINLIHNKLDEYHHQILLEIQELNLEDISDRKLKSALYYLENKLNVKGFEEFLLFQNKDNTINPMLRLYSQLKKEIIKRAREKELTDISEIANYYIAICEQRLLENYEKVFEKQMPEVDMTYLSILYNIMYSFIGFEQTSSYKIDLKYWVPNIETFKSIEKSQISLIFYEYLKIIDKSEIELLYDPFTMNAVSIHFFAILNLLPEKKSKLV